jgi:hypothetical protein
LLHGSVNLTSLEDGSMAPTRTWIETLVMRIQGEFLNRPALGLTVSQAERHFGIDRPTCDAVLGVLADANVLTRSADGTYRRLFPRHAQAA